VIVGAIATVTLPVPPESSAFASPERLPDHLVHVPLIVYRYACFAVQRLYLKNCSLAARKHTLRNFIAQNMLDEKPLSVNLSIGNGPSIPGKSEVRLRRIARGRR
jgi:hypothetical protein